jgi:hypothetical protein
MSRSYTPLPPSASMACSGTALENCLSSGYGFESCGRAADSVTPCMTLFHPWPPLAVLSWQWLYYHPIKSKNP